MIILLFKEDIQMSVYYNEDFKMEVVRAYMAREKSTADIAAAIVKGKR